MESGRFEYGKHGMRGQGWTMVLATVSREGRRACRWRGARARLLKPGSHMMGKVIVIGRIACPTVEIGHVRNIAQGRQGQVSFARRGCSCGSRSHRCGVRERPGIGISAAVLSSVARGKGRCSCDGCFFHSARVLILVTSQSSATRKGLLAIRERAFVWSFPRVYATMSGQGARIAERLPSLSA